MYKRDLNAQIMYMPENVVFDVVFDNYSEKSVVDFKYMKIKGYICLLNVQLRVIAKANKLITNL